MKQLRPYQEQVIEEIRSAFRAGHKSVVLQLPTGGGKTLTVSTMIKRALERGNEAWFVCHRRELVDQASGAMRSMEIPHGLIAAGSYPMLLKPVQVCSIQTLIRRYERLKLPKMVIYDECHHMAASQWEETYKYLTQAGCVIIGLTATPERLDGKGLNKFFSHMVIGPSTADLIHQGYLSPYKAFAPGKPDTSKLHIRMGDFAKNEVEEMMDKPSIVGDVVEHYLKYAKGRRAIMFAASVKHSQHLVEAFRTNGVTAAHVDGASDPVLRKEAIRKFASGETMILSNVELFGEGFDVPAAEVCIMVRPTNSLSLFLQQAGRVLRPVYADGMPLDTDEQRRAAIAAGPKPYAVILDHAGNCLRHGLPDEDRAWSLNGRESAGTKKKKQTESVRQCPKCYHVQKPTLPACSSCGHVFEIQARKLDEREGELVEMTKEKAAEIAKQRQQQLRYEQALAKTYEDLVQLGRQRGYKQPQNWAKYVISGRSKRA